MSGAAIHAALSDIAALGGLLLFVAAFILVLIYALRPGARDRFRSAAALPLKDDDRPHDPGQMS